MNVIRSLLFAILFAASPRVFAQNGLRLEIIGGSSLNNLSWGMLPRWGTGWTIGGGYAYQLSHAVDLIAGLTYSRYPYPADGVRYYNVERVGYDWDVVGEASSVIEGSLGFRIFGPIPLAQMFLSPRVGIYGLNFGEIVAREWPTSNPGIESHYIYPWSGYSTVKGFGALGLGLSVPFNSSVGMVVESRFTQTFDGEESIVSVLGSIQFYM